MNTSMADGASERLDAQIADALFGQPGMSKMDVANRLRELRGDGAPVLADAGKPVSPSPAGQGDALDDGAGRWEAPPAKAVDLAEFKVLYQAYVRLLESGRDRIIDLGGSCDPVDVMEAKDLDLQAARRVIDSKAVGK